MLKCVKLTRFAVLPTRATPLSAGVDLRSAYDYSENSGDRIVVETDLAVQLPEGTYGKIEPRSGLALNFAVDILGGIVDEDFRGSIKIILINHGKGIFYVNRGDRVAQLICNCIKYPIIMECKELDKTIRGPQGFGSSGNK